MAKRYPFIFVLMPFKSEFDDIYQLGIKVACTEAGGHCERVDEQIFLESILERIYDQIEKADLVVADMSGQNINVFYETGFAHALGKQVILVTQNAHDIPFDLKHYPHIIYGNRILELKDQLRLKVEWLLAHPVEGRSIRDTKAILEYKAKLEKKLEEGRVKLEAERKKQTKNIKQLKAAHKVALQYRDSQIAVLKFQINQSLKGHPAASHNPNFLLDHWSLLFDFDYVYRSAACLAKSYNMPRDWRMEIKKHKGDAVIQMIAWNQLLNGKRTPWMIRKTLRTIRDKRDMALYISIFSGQTARAKKQLREIAKVIIAKKRPSSNSTIVQEESN